LPFGPLLAPYLPSSASCYEFLEEKVFVYVQEVENAKSRANTIMINEKQKVAKENSSKARINAMKARANKSEINKKLSTLKQHHRARGLQEVEISQISEVIILELQTTLIEYEVTYTETITEIYIEESIEVTSEETTTISESYNSKVANEKKKINQTKISLQNTHDSIKQTKREISKAKKMLKDTKNKIVSTNEKLKINSKININRHSASV